MARNQFLVTKSLRGLKPLGAPGQRSYEMISDTVRKELGDRHADIFAEPVGADAGNSVDWYISEAENPRHIDSLSPDEADIVNSELAELIEDIKKLADKLKNSNFDDEQRRGEALENAIRYPESGNVFVVPKPGGGYSPVLVNWAYEKEEVQRKKVKLTGRVPRLPEPETDTIDSNGGTRLTDSGSPDTADEGAARHPTKLRDYRWLLIAGWIIFAILAAWIIWLLFVACGINVLGANFCPRDEKSEIVELERAHEGLLSRINMLENELAALGADCGPSAETAELDPSETEIIVEERLEREQVVRGDLDFALVWNGSSDLDLSVTCPNNVRISFQSRSPRNCNGKLDVDANSSSQRLTENPIEHITFSEPFGKGRFKVQVSLYKSRQAGGQPFTLQVRKGGVIETFSGVLNDSNKNWTATVTYPE